MRRFFRGIFVLTVVIVLSLGVLADKYVDAMFTTKAPKIDGVLNDDIWAKAAKKADFSVSSGGTPANKTEFMVAWDKDNLYVAITNYVNTKLLAQNITQDNGATWEDDENSVFLNPTLPETISMYQYSFNSIPIRNGLAYGGTQRPDLELWEVAVKIEKDYYVAEIKISFETTEAWPEVGDEWGFNIGRNCTSAGQAYSWSTLTSGQFIDATSFGVVRFVK